MGIRSEEKIIDGKKVISTTLPPTSHIALQVKLFKILGPSVGEFFKAIGGTKSKLKISDIDVSKFAGIFETLACKLDPEEFTALILEILKSTLVNGQDVSKQDTFNIVFTDEYDLMYKVVYFALEVNFKSFLSKMGIGNVLLKLQEKEKEEAKKNPIPGS